jgi:ubiquinone/menaquinone biosynthesis C-methylase UbiE
VTTAHEFDDLFRAEADDHRFATTVRLVDPGLPPEIEPYSFLSTDLLDTLVGELDLRHGQLLADLGCGRGGPGLWLAHRTRTRLVGVDFSPVAAAQARRHAATYEPPPTAAFVVAGLTASGLASRAVDAAVSIDAMQYAVDRIAAASEARRIIRPQGRLVLTGWHPRTRGDAHLPVRHRHTDWNATLQAAGFAAIRCATDERWDHTYQQIYRTAVTNCSATVTGLPAEAQRRLPTAHLLRRVVVTAIA